MVEACTQALCELTEQNSNIVVMGADYLNVGERILANASGQYLEMGISEANLVGAAAGVASMGLIPYVYAMAPFLIYRANEFIRDDLCLQNANVKIIGYSAGMDFCTSGPTHQTTEDIGTLRVIPNLTILAPGSVKEVMEMVKAAADIEGPVYIRLNRERNREFHDEEYHFRFNKADILHEGNDVALISTGSFSYDALNVAKLAEKEGIGIKVLHLGTLKPVDTESILQVCKGVRNVVTLEEHNILGGLGAIVAEIIAENGIGVKLTRLGLRDCFAQGYGNHDEIKKMNGLSLKNIMDACISPMKGMC